MLVRKATAADIDSIAQLFDAYRMFYKQTSDLEAARNFIAKRFLLNESIIFIAEDYAGNAVGFTQLYPIFSSVSMRRTLLLNDLYVDEKSRGKGIATTLMNAAAAYAKEKKCKWLLLQTGADNTNAQALYEKNGWKKCSDFFYQFDI